MTGDYLWDRSGTPDPEVERLERLLSAFKQAGDRASAIVRLFNPGDEEANVIVSLDAPVAQAFAVNFLEERQAALAVDGGGVALRLRPKQIQTIELVARV